MSRVGPGRRASGRLGPRVNVGRESSSGFDGLTGSTTVANVGCRHGGWRSSAARPSRIPFPSPESGTVSPSPFTNSDHRYGPAPHRQPPAGSADRVVRVVRTMGAPLLDEAARIVKGTGCPQPGGRPVTAHEEFVHFSSATREPLMSATSRPSPTYTTHKPKSQARAPWPATSRWPRCEDRERFPESHVG